jgi:hypothetical protein
MLSEKIAPQQQETTIVNADDTAWLINFIFARITVYSMLLVQSGY